MYLGRIVELAQRRNLCSTFDALLPSARGAMPSAAGPPGRRSSGTTFARQSAVRLPIPYALPLRD